MPAMGQKPSFYLEMPRRLVTAGTSRSHLKGIGRSSSTDEPPTDQSGEVALSGSNALLWDSR